MYQETSYVPKISGEKKGEAILSKHGVTQGRKTSTSLFPFAVRNILNAIKLLQSVLGNNHAFQLADDSSIVTKPFEDLLTGFNQ